MRTFRILLIVSLIVTLAGTLLPAQAQDVKTTKDLLTRDIEAFNQRKLELIDELYTKDAVTYLAGQGNLNLDQLKAEVQSEYDTYSGARQIPGAFQIAEGDYAATSFVWEGTFSKPVKGPKGEIKPNGKKLQVNVIFIIRVKDGKIAEGWRLYDTLSFYQQMGAVPVQGELPAFKAWDIKLGTGNTPVNDMKAKVTQFGQDWPKRLGLEYLASDFTWNMPPSQGTPLDLAGFVKWTKMTLSVFPDFAHKAFPGKAAPAQIVEGDLMATTYAISFKFTNDIAGIPANGAQIVVPAAMILRFKDGQIVEAWPVWDTGSMFKQMMAPKA